MRTKKRKIVALLSNDENREENENWNREFWEGVPDEQKFSAAWEMVRTAWQTKGRDLRELRLERTIALFKPPSN